MLILILYHLNEFRDVALLLLIHLRAEYHSYSKNRNHNGGIGTDEKASRETFGEHEMRQTMHVNLIYDPWNKDKETYKDIVIKSSLIGLLHADKLTNKLFYTLLRQIYLPYPIS